MNDAALHCCCWVRFNFMAGRHCVLFWVGTPTVPMWWLYWNDWEGRIIWQCFIVCQSETLTLVHWERRRSSEFLLNVQFTPLFTPLPWHEITFAGSTRHSAVSDTLNSWPRERWRWPAETLRWVEWQGMRPRQVVLFVLHTRGQSIASGCVKTDSPQRRARTKTQKKGLKK